MYLYKPLLTHCIKYKNYILYIIKKLNSNLNKMIDTIKMNYDIAYENKDYFSQFVYETLTENFYSIEDELYTNKPPLTDIQCLFVMSYEDNILYTFDKSHKIQVIIPRDKLLANIMYSSNYLCEGAFDHYIVKLIHPILDLKVGFDANSGTYILNCVLFAENYTKIEKEGRFGTNVTNKVRFEGLHFVDYGDGIRNVYLEYFRRILENNILDKILSNNSFFDEDNKFEFFEKFDLLLFSQLKFPKVKMSEAQFIHPDELNNPLIKQAFSQSSTNNNIVQNNTLRYDDVKIEKVENECSSPETQTNNQSTFYERSRMTLNNFGSDKISMHQTIDKNTFTAPTILKKEEVEEDYHQLPQFSSIRKLDLESSQINQPLNINNNNNSYHNLFENNEEVEIIAEGQNRPAIEISRKDNIELSESTRKKFEGRLNKLTEKDVSPYLWYASFLKHSGRTNQSGESNY